LVHVELRFLLLGVGDGRPERLQDVPGGGLLRVAKDRDGAVDLLAAPEVGPGAGPGRPGAPATAAPASAAFLPPCPLKIRVGANSPSLWPTMFSAMYTWMNFRLIIPSYV